MINLTGGEYVEAVKQKLIVPYDYSVIDASHVPPEYKEEYGIKFSLYLFVMCWDRKKTPDDKAPKSWAEFWDTLRFPGKRSLDANISDGSTLEQALLADGVPIDQLFPLDVERALKSLEKLGRGNINLAQCQPGADPAAHIRRGHIGGGLRWPRIAGQQVWRRSWFHAQRCCRQRQLLLRQQRVGEQAGGDAVPQLHADRQPG